MLARFPAVSSTYCHFPCGSVDWNMQLRNISIIRNSHFPCGSVDWNLKGNELRYDERLSLPLWKCGLKLRIVGCWHNEWSVTSLVEVWIEICIKRIYYTKHTRSLPLWKCGLKLPYCRHRIGWSAVTSLVEVWIEILPHIPPAFLCSVTSLVEVWIEICNYTFGKQ